jgi:hypothetical protein
MGISEPMISFADYPSPLFDPSHPLVPFASILKKLKIFDFLLDQFRRVPVLEIIKCHEKLETEGWPGYMKYSADMLHLASLEVIISSTFVSLET